MKFNYKFKVGDVLINKENPDTHIEITRRIGHYVEPFYGYTVYEGGEVRCTRIDPESWIECHYSTDFKVSKVEDITVIDINTFEEKRNITSISDCLVGVKESIPTILKYGRNLSQKAYNNDLAPCYNRESELEILQYTLYRRTKPNCMLLGKAGVGKSAIVEQLAQSFNKAYENGKDKIYTVIVELSLNAMVSGAKYRGDFEERIQKVLSEVENFRNKHRGQMNLVLFIDEIHSINEIGNAEGATSAGQILKPALARGEICVIGATTTEEYKKHLSMDTAFCRRFNNVEVKELSGDIARSICRNILNDYSKHFEIGAENVDIEGIYDDNIKKLKGTFPDNFINLIDETFAYAKYKELTEIDTRSFDRVLERYGAKEVVKLGFR